VGWFGRRSTRSAAERSLEELQAPPRPTYVEELLLDVVERPVSTAPGTPLHCVQNGDPLRVGAPVALVTASGPQVTSVVSLTVGGTPVDVVEEGDDEAVHVQVVLGDGVDLREVRRSSWIGDPGVTTADRGDFVFEIEHAEPRGRDVLVVGRTLVGTPPEGKEVSCTEVVDNSWYVRARLKQVETVGDRVGLVLKGLPAERFEPGDLVTWFA
jgi:hypothetical protein